MFNTTLAPFWQAQNEKNLFFLKFALTNEGEECYCLKKTMKCVLSQVMALLLWLLAPLFLLGPALELPVPCCHAEGFCPAQSVASYDQVDEARPESFGEGFCGSLEPHHHHYRSLSLLDDAGRRTAPTALPHALNSPPEVVSGCTLAAGMTSAWEIGDRCACLPRSAGCRPLRC